MATLIEDTLSVREEFELQHDRLVREEIETFRVKANAFLAGEIPEDDFRPFRLKHGIYGQRQPGVQMVRCKVPGGLLTAAQMEQLARIGETFAGGKGHITTRQNMQYHFVPLAQTADVMHLAGRCGPDQSRSLLQHRAQCHHLPIGRPGHDEVFDVRPYAQHIAYAFLRKDLTGNLPRKFKIAFDGCGSHDCIAGAINDIGLRAVVRDGRRGFRVVIGGGLGPLPTEAQLLDEFLPEERLMNRCEAVVRVFNQYGNRQNRNKARMKFVLRERGIEWLREQIEREYDDILENGGIAWPELVPEGFGGYQSHPQPLGTGALLPVIHSNGTGDPQYDRWLETNIIQQKQAGYATVVARVDQGNLTSAQMRGLARLAADAGDGLLRLGIDQNILLGFIPLGRLRGLHAALRAAGPGRSRRARDCAT